MLTCFVTTSNNAIPIFAVTPAELPQWLASQSNVTKQWVTSNCFQAKANSFLMIPNDQGNCQLVLVGVKQLDDFWALAGLPQALPQADYFIANNCSQDIKNNMAIAWGLGSYQYTRYKKPKNTVARLQLQNADDSDAIDYLVKTFYWMRDLINTPSNDMLPQHLSAAARELAQQYSMNFSEVIGDDLLTHNYPAIHAVGRASTHAPRLLDLRWGDPQAPKVTLVGKGVCFDTGGLDIKPSNNMLLMKKDMSGAAHVLGLASLIMHAKLPVRLRVLIPAVENAISGDAFRPGDVITTRAGITVEISNTDAEGRLVLCDALAEAVTEQPTLLIDWASLTGAHRTALGTDIPGLFCNNDKLAEELLTASQQTQDAIWQLPLFTAYRDQLDSNVADIKNSALSPYAGAITAALYLKEFVPNHIAWAHYDMMAWNVSSRPGRPEGGEVFGIRALFHYLKSRF